MEGIGRAVTMLGHDDVGLARTVLLVVEVGAVHEEHHVGVLLDRAGFAKVGQLRLLVVAHLGAAVELGKRHNRHLKLLGEQLQRTGEFGDLLLAAFHTFARGHQLQVVDDHEFQVVGLLEPPAFGTDLHQAHVRAVVDEQRRVLHAVPELVQRVPPFRRDVVGAAQRDQRDVRFGGDDALRQFRLAHLQAEHDGGQAVVQRGGTGEVDAERGLAHGRAAGDHDHLAGLQALRHVVDVAEARGHTAFHIALLEIVQHLQRVLDGIAERRVILPHTAHAHLVDLGLGQVHHVLGLGALRRIPELGDLGAGGNHVAQDRALVHDLGVERGVRGGRHRGHQTVQVVGATDLLQVAGFEQLVGHQHHIHRLRAGEQRDDGLIDGLMLRLIEIGDVDHLRDLADGVLAHQHAAQHGHLGVIIVRGHTVEDHVTRRRTGGAGRIRRVTGVTVRAARTTAVPARTGLIPTVSINHTFEYRCRLESR